MTNKEFGKLQELILMFEKDFRGICRKSGRTCNDCSFSAGYEGCTLSQCSKAISEIRGVKKDGTTIIVGDYKLTKDGKAKVYDFIEQSRIYKKELIKSGVETEHSKLDNNRNVIATKSCSLITVAAPVSPSSDIHIACFGDSLTSGGTWCKESPFLSHSS